MFLWRGVDPRLLGRLVLAAAAAMAKAKRSDRDPAIKQELPSARPAPAQPAPVPTAHGRGSR
jgi:hypothetical protein